MRVPVLVGHSAAVWLETRDAVSLPKARQALEGFPGIVLEDDPRRAVYPTPLSAAGTDPVYAGRLRLGSGPRELLLWLVCDNLRKGAALNSVQIAEHLLKKGWLS